MVGGMDKGDSLMGGLLIKLSDYRRTREQAAATAERTGKILGIGIATTIVNACLDEKRAADKCSQGYAEAAFDITSRLLDELRKLK